MQTDTHWFVHLCLENQAITEEQFQSTYASIGNDASTEAWSQAVIDLGNDPEWVQSVVDTALSYASEGYELPELPATSSHTNAEASTTSVSTDGLPDFETLHAADDAQIRATVKDLIFACAAMGASDLHLTAEAKPRIRKKREIHYLSDQPLDAELAKRLNTAYLSEAQMETFEKDQDLDYALSIEGHEHQRFRVNLMEQHHGVSAVYHIVPSKIQSLEELGFPNAETIKNLLSYHNGILLVTGPVGSGKTTTLATLVNELNRTRTDHVITIEDPVEIVQASDKCIVSQRQVGLHTSSFAAALKSALREDPDIIVIGEMRDLETIEMAITAAETGHLVIGTMHTKDAATTLSRLLDVFPPSQQSQIRAMTAGSLRGIICQRLLPSTSDGLVLASELLLNSTGVANMIREGKEIGLKSAMQTGKRKGMRLMDDSIVELFQSGQITAETTYGNLQDKQAFQNQA